MCFWLPFLHSTLPTFHAHIHDDVSCVFCWCVQKQWCSNPELPHGSAWLVATQCMLLTEQKQSYLGYITKLINRSRVCVAILSPVRDLISLPETPRLLTVCYWLVFCEELKPLGGVCVCAVFLVAKKHSCVWWLWCRSGDCEWSVHIFVRTIEIWWMCTAFAGCLSLVSARP